jgi:hypothetical protein
MTKTLGDFQTDSMGVDYPDYFQGYGTSFTKYTDSCYGIGATEAEALDDCLEALSQCLDFDDITEERIRDEFGTPDDTEMAPDEAFFHVGIKWTIREEDRLERVMKLTDCPVVYSRYDRDDTGAWGYISRADGSASYGDFKPVKWHTDPRDVNRELYFFVPYASGSDYSGSTVERSNYVVFLAENVQDWIHEVYGDFGTYAVAVSVNGLLSADEDVFDLICDTIEKLEDYPLIDDEALSQLEMEGTDEAWTSWVQSDFVRGLEKHFEGVDFEFPHDGLLREFFEKMAERANEYWYCEGCGRDTYIAIDRVIAKIDFADVEQWAIRYEVVFNAPDGNREDYFDENAAKNRVESLRANGIMGAFYNVIAPQIDGAEFGIVEGGTS